MRLYASLFILMLKYLSTMKNAPPRADMMIAASDQGNAIHHDDVAAVVNDKPPTTLLAVWIPWLIPSSSTCGP